VVDRDRCDLETSRSNGAQSGASLHLESARTLHASSNHGGVGFQRLLIKMGSLGAPGPEAIAANRREIYGRCNFHVLSRNLVTVIRSITARWMYHIHVAASAHQCRKKMLSAIDQPNIAWPRPSTGHQVRFCRRRSKQIQDHRQRRMNARRNSARSLGVNS
jgi:hypothetical protein